MTNLYRNFSFFGLLLFSSDLFARAGGGGGSGSGDGEGDAASLVVIGLMYAIYHIRRARMIRQAKRQFAKATENDPSWDMDHFKETAKAIFYRYQKAWMKKDLTAMQPFFHPDYFKESNEIMKHKLAGKKNILKKVELKSIQLMSVLDIKGQEGDMFVLELKFKLIDYTIDEVTGKFLDSPLKRKEKESFYDWGERAQTQQNKVTEYWVFYRYRGHWLLHGIHQVSSFFWDLKHASKGKLLEILAEERSKPKDAPVDDSFFYKKAD